MCFREILKKTSQKVDRTSKRLLLTLYIGSGENPLRQPERCEKVEICKNGSLHDDTATNLANVAVWTAGNWSRTLFIEQAIEVLG